MTNTNGSVFRDICRQKNDFATVLRKYYDVIKLYLFITVQPRNFALVVMNKTRCVRIKSKTVKYEL